MPDTELQAVIVALKNGDRSRARYLLKPLLEQPTADRWYLAALLSGNRRRAQQHLQHALRLDPDHERAQRKLQQLQDHQSPDDELDLPPLTALIADEVAIPTERPYNPDLAESQMFVTLRENPLKRPRCRRRRIVWTNVGCIGMILLSLSSTYFVLMVLGSGLPGRLRGIITGNRPVEDTGGEVVYATPVAIVNGVPYYGRPLSEYGSAGLDVTPVTAINGTPVYARPDAVVVVSPLKSQILTRQQPISDILEPGFAHEYRFNATQGEELAIGIQFFSPTAQRVSRNIAILDPGGRNAGGECQQDSLLQGDNGLIFSCQIHMSGDWQIRLFGREGESSGVYVVAIETFS